MHVIKLFRVLQIPILINRKSVDKFKKTIMLGKYTNTGNYGGDDMDTTTIIRIVAGVLVVIILFVLISRRRSRKQ
jgi:hypothetical protein